MRNKSILCLILFLSIQVSVSAKEVPSAGEMFVDLTLARPIGILGLGVGTCLFIIATPFNLINFAYTGSSEGLKNSGKRLFLNPLHYTFGRSLGDYPGYMEEIETIKE